ncbi:MAG: amidohydrolase/deacetylase family metallohydrolase [Chloroflexi bacterium]|nr:amidohydrolase/deacetylase family metallohydrolase [Chloroflexota bacterium]MCL5108861.1 amidohydrolase/deacetylase family metallohydrolase [Chloroflexota bacterium]
MPKYDLLLKGGRVLDPSQDLDCVCDVAVTKGVITGMAPDLSWTDAGRAIDVSGTIVMPGLVDFHTHAYWGVCEYGVDPDLTFLPRGTTTILDVGSAGAITLPGFRHYVVERSRTRIKALLHVNTAGMTHSVGELIGLQYLDPERTAAVAKENADLIVGIKVRLSRNVAGENDWQAFQAARKAAELAGIPLMVHFGSSFTPLAQVLDAMRPGDILTHCFSGRANNIMDEKGRLLPEVWAAVRRGVNVDVGHGMGSFNFDTASAALKQGLLPTTISSDLHAYSQPYPVIDLLTVMSKFVYVLGLPLGEVVRRATAVPAQLLGLADVAGSLRVGAPADVAVVRELAGQFELWDADKNSRLSPNLLTPFLTLRAGEVF